MKRCSTKTLVNELKTRLGVKEIVVKPYEKLETQAGTIEGPARVLIVID